MKQSIISTALFIQDILPALLRASGVTVSFNLWINNPGIVIGTGIALMRISRNKVLSGLGTAYVTVLRERLLWCNLIVYFALPHRPQVGQVQLGSSCAGDQRKCIYSRDNQGCHRVHRSGQMEAARSLGMATAWPCGGSSSLRPTGGLPPLGMNSSPCLKIRP